MSDNHLGLKSADASMMDTNLPVQAWRSKGEPTRFVCYMPRKEACFGHDEATDEAEYARDAAKILRNLAALFDAFADGKIDHVYYPDRELSEAIAEAAKDRAEVEPA